METLCRIRDIYRAVAAFEVEFERRHNLCLNEGMLLCSLAKTEKLSSGELAEMLGLTTSNTSKVIKSVEEKNLVERVMGRVDKRQMYFFLTKKGKQVLEEIKCNETEFSELLQDIFKK